MGPLFYSDKRLVHPIDALLTSGGVPLSLHPTSRMFETIVPPQSFTPLAHGSASVVKRGVIDSA